MPRFTLVVFDRYEAARSTIHYHDTPQTNLGLAFQEALTKLWGFEDGTVIDTSNIKEYKNKVGLDFEEESYLFFQS